ncbi:MAG: glycosyltransferase family 2 protein [Clostridia bacterium]|nr:glycosyltransferase family 2 protein [Clostridia bacterium]
MTAIEISPSSNSNVSPKISVLMPVYNCEKYLEKSLDSVLNQTFKDIELICVNDGSKDNSLEILKEYSKKDSRLVLIDQKNQGAAAARQNAINKAKGEYIAFVDADDIIAKNAYEISYKFIKNMMPIYFALDGKISSMKMKIKIL